MRLSLKVKAAVAITLLFLGMMALIASVQTRYMRADLMHEVAGAQVTLVERAAKDLDQRLETNLLALTREALAIPPEILAHPREFQTYLERQPTMLLLFDSLLIFSATGELLADAPAVPGRKGLQVGDREYFQRALATRKPTVSAPYIGRAAHRPIVVMIAPILDRNNRLVGFLGGTLDLLKRNFLGSLATTTIGKSGFFFIITNDQPSVYVVHRDPGLILKPATGVGVGATQAGERALAGLQGTVEGVDDQGIPVLLSYKSVATTNWTLAANYPLAEAMAPVIADERRLWWITASLAVLLAPLVWVLTWFLIAPLMRLQSDVQRLNEGSGLIAPQLQRRQDEIGDLARNFNALVAERQQNVEALRRSTQLLDNIVENIPVAVQLKAVNDDFRFVMWNKAAETMYGLPRERVIGRTAHETWSAEDIARYREADLLAVASNGQEFKHRAAATVHRGTIIVHMRKTPLFDADGVATHLLVIMEDITDRVAADARLAQSEARFRSAAESALDAFFILDSVRDDAGKIRDFRFRYLNANAERMLAAPGGLAIGRLLCEMFPARRTEGLFDQYKSVVETGTPLDQEFKVNFEDDRVTWLHQQVVRLEDGIAITAHDISGRKAAEEELRSNRTFLQSLIDNLPMAICVKDVRPEQFGKMLVWNKGAEVIGGILEQDALGRRDSELFSPDVYLPIEAHDRELLASPMVSEVAEHPYRRPDGSLVFMHTISAPLFGSDGKPEFILRISEDVTLQRRQRKELGAKTAELLAVSDASPLGMFRTDAQGRQTYVNRTHEILTGLSAQDALASGWVRSIHAADRERVVRQWGEAIRGHKNFESLHRYQHRDGRIVWASVKAAPVVVDGNVVGFVGSVDDHTTRREAEHALQTSEHRLRTITDAIPAWIAYMDRQEVYSFANLAYQRAFGLAREQVLGRTIREVVGEATYGKAKPYLSRVFGGETVTFEREQPLANGVCWVEVTYIPEFDEESGEVVGFYAMLQDITQKKLEEQRLVRLSQIDSLTGLANRVGLEQRLADAMAESRKTGTALAVMYVDIDRFKPVNDTHGHAVGDALLIEFSQRLSDSLRKTDVIARFGGDEFVAVVPGMLEPKTIAALAAKTLKAIQRPCVFSEHGVTLSVTASMGIACYDGGETTPAQLVAEADALLYAAKERGRNNFCIAAWPRRARSAEESVT